MTEKISEGTAFDPLLFPKDDYTVETKMVKTSAREKTAAYRCYMLIPYVANPVGTEYQSLNVAVDATNAPVLLRISSAAAMTRAYCPTREGARIHGT